MLGYRNSLPSFRSCPFLALRFLSPIWRSRNTCEGIPKAVFRQMKGQHLQESCLSLHKFSHLYMRSNSIHGIRYCDLLTLHPSKGLVFIHRSAIDLMPESPGLDAQIMVCYVSDLQMSHRHAKPTEPSPIICKGNSFTSLALLMLNEFLCSPPALQY